MFAKEEKASLCRLKRKEEGYVIGNVFWMWLESGQSETDRI